MVPLEEPLKQRPKLWLTLKSMLDPLSIVGKSSIILIGFMLRVRNYHIKGEIAFPLSNQLNDECYEKTAPILPTRTRWKSKR